MCAEKAVESPEMMVTGGGGCWELDSGSLKKVYTLTHQAICLDLSMLVTFICFIQCSAKIPQAPCCFLSTTASATTKQKKQVLFYISCKYLKIIISFIFCVK